MTREEQARAQPRRHPRHGQGAVGDLRRGTNKNVPSVEARKLGIPVIAIMTELRPDRSTSQSQATTTRDPLGPLLTE